jgi:purine-nucleoside phosphorylase
VPARLRPTAPLAADAILVGDPGRALMLAQELLEQPKMSNHARGLWGYSGRTVGGDDLTIQSTGMGGPSAAIVLADLAKLGVRRAVRIGTCTALDPDRDPGELLLVEAAVAAGGSATSFGLDAGEATEPDPALLQRLRQELPEVTEGLVASFDALSAEAAPAPAPAGVAVADMQTVALFARGLERGIGVAAILIVAESETGEVLGVEDLEAAAKAAGQAAAASLSASS